jgi:hypothetical protein
MEVVESQVEVVGNQAEEVIILEEVVGNQAEEAIILEKVVGN